MYNLFKGEPPHVIASPPCVGGRGDLSLKVEIASPSKPEGTPSKWEGTPSKCEGTPSKCEGTPLRGS